MGRNKMETEFREKLSQREIQPSAAAWDRLDAMLSTAEAQQKKPKRTFLYFLAAAVVGVALVASMFLLQDNQASVEVPVEVADTQQDKAPAVVPVESPKIQLAETKPQVQDQKTNIPVRVEMRPQPKRIAQKELIASNEVPENIQQETAEVKSPEVAPLLPQNEIPEKLLAAIKAKTDAQKTASVKVNARSLLREVEPENEAPSKQTLLQRLGRNYQTVKVAVANRNLEENQ